MTPSEAGKVLPQPHDPKFVPRIHFSSQDPALFLWILCCSLGPQALSQSCTTPCTLGALISNPRLLQRLPGASVRNSARDKVMRKEADIRKVVIRLPEFPLAFP